MPFAPKRPCLHPGCPALTENGRCPTHARQQQQALEANRLSSHERGYDARWHKARTWFLQQHPLCTQCHAEGRVVAATVVDHREPHKGDMKLFWQQDNWQSLCEHHHNQKTVTDGRWNERRYDHTELR